MKAYEKAEYYIIILRLETHMIKIKYEKGININYRLYCSFKPIILFFIAIRTLWDKLIKREIPYGFLKQIGYFYNFLIQNQQSIIYLLQK